MARFAVVQDSAGKVKLAFATVGDPAATPAP
jgi:hypothetical protein